MTIDREGPFHGRLPSFILPTFLIIDFTKSSPFSHLGSFSCSVETWVSGASLGCPACLEEEPVVKVKEFMPQGDKEEGKELTVDDLKGWQNS